MVYKKHKSSLPLSIKIKLWDVIRQENTYRNFQSHLALKPEVLTTDEWGLLGTIKDDLELRATAVSRDTYDNLIAEIKFMPLKELADLRVEVIINWERGRRGHKHLEITINELLEMHITHRQKLAEAAKRLADNLTPYLLVTGGVLEDYVFGEFKETVESDIAQQLAIDAPTRWLFSHLKAEHLFPEDTGSWCDILVKNTMHYQQTLYDKAENKEFIGICEVCKNWDPIK
jgi:hypothetical protein